MNIKRTLVIGGAGFIGKGLVPKLIESGRSVTVLSRTALNLEKIDGVTYLSGSFLDEDLITNLLEVNDEVVHLAYVGVPNTSFVNPLSDLLDNLPPTIQLMNLCARNNVKLVIISSGGTVYGQSQYLPIDENHPKYPISGYGVTKLTIEHYAYLYKSNHDLSCLCIRPSNPYGENQSYSSGQGFIATAIASAFKGQPVVIYGESGTIRDYIYIDDLCCGIVKAIDYGIEGETYNVGSGVGYSNLDIVKKLEPLLASRGLSLQVDLQPERVFDVKENILDPSKLNTLTGWRPEVEITVGLDKVITYMEKKKINSNWV